MNPASPPINPDAYMAGTLMPGPDMAPDIQPTGNDTAVHVAQSRWSVALKLPTAAEGEGETRSVAGSLERGHQVIKGFLSRSRGDGAALPGCNQPGLARR